jgi:hypothetical protein
MLANRLQATASLLNRLTQRAQIRHREQYTCLRSSGAKSPHSQPSPPLSRGGEGQGEGGFCRASDGYNTDAGGV